MTQQPSAEDLNAALEEAVRLHEGGRIDDAAALYDSILDKAPDNPDALYLRGTLAAQQQDHDTAEALLRRAISSAPRVPAIHNNLGIVLRAGARWEDAAAHFRRAIVLNPRYPEALANLAATQYTLGDADEAAATYRRVLDIQPDFGQALIELASILFEKQAFDEATLMLRRAADVDPERLGYGAACVMGEAFDTLTQPDRLDGLLGDLPPLEGEFPQAVTGGGVTVMVACDHAYFAQFGKALALALNRNSPGLRLHLHIFDPGAEIDVELAELGAQMPETSLTATREGARGAGPAILRQRAVRASLPAPPGVRDGCAVPRRRQSDPARPRRRFRGRRRRGHRGVDAAQRSGVAQQDLGQRRAGQADRSRLGVFSPGSRPTSPPPPWTAS